MKRFFFTSSLAVLIFVTPVVAQQAGTNVNVLPVVQPIYDGDNLTNPDWWKLGDGYLQRQVEPTVGASTLNPNHLLAFFNDYRAVDVVEGDVGLGEGELVTGALKIAALLLPPTISSGLPKMELIPPINAAEAWIGGSRSYDGGYTWSGFFLPGAPWDDSDASLSAPIYGLQAATDPVLAVGPCGAYYLAFVAFTRGGESKVVVARYLDTNNFESGDSIVYSRMTVVESGNNAEYGYFLDKPDIEVDLMRPADPNDQCAHRIYLTYSTFNGLTKDEKVQTKMNFAVSEDYGETFSTIKINKTFNQNQGSAIAIDPRPGTPTTTGGGTVYVFWRHFFDPHAMVVRKSLDYGVKWSIPQVITNNPALVQFDQPTISESLAPTPEAPPALNNEFPELAFRSNGFPTAAVAPFVVTDNGTPTDPSDDVWDSTVFVAWQERLDGDGFPAADGDPGIVMMRSTDEGGSWTGFDPDPAWEDAPAGDRRAVDKEPRFEPFDPQFPMPSPDDDPSWKSYRDAGGQVQPRLSIGGGRLMLTFFESRGRIGDYGTPLEYMASAPWYGVDFTPFITGYDRVVDFRATLLDPADGTRLSSAQISRYPIRLGADLSDGQDLSDVAAINAPCHPDTPSAQQPCVRQVNRANAPTSAQGTSPFIGDYVDTVPYVQFVPDGNGDWRWAIRSTDVPSRGFHAIWTDNRHLIPPFEIPGATEDDPNLPLPDDMEEWKAYPFYGPPGIGGACANPGSRNTDVLTSRVATEVLLTAPTTFKQLDLPRSFPFSIENKTNDFRRFSLEITSDTAPEPDVNFATFSAVRENNGDYYNQDTYEVNVFPFSNSSLTVYVTPPLDTDDPTAAVGPIVVSVMLEGTTLDPLLGTNSESNIDDWDRCDPERDDCLVGTITFNAYPGNEWVNDLTGNPEDFGPEVTNAFVINWTDAPTSDPNTAFVINNFLDNAFVINAFVINTSPDNAFVINDALDNAFVINTELQNAFVINRSEPVYGITDTVWTMTPKESNTAGAYVPLPNIDNADELVGKYAWQLIVDKNSAYGSAAACGPYNVSQQQVLANVVQNPADPNAFVINDFVENAFVINPTVQNAFVINSAFTLPPSGGGNNKSLTTKDGTITETGTAAPPPPSEVRITLRAYQLVPYESLPIDPYTGAKIEYNPILHPATIAIFHQGCDHTITDPNDEDFCIEQIGADLVIDSVELTDDLVVELPSEPYSYPYENVEPPWLNPVPECGVIDFPGFVLENIGNRPAIPRSGTLHHAVFLSDNSSHELDTDLLLTEPPDRDFDSPEGSLSWDGNPDGETASHHFPDPTEIQLPTHVSAGSYYLILAADYPREASEYNENNNTAVLRLEVLPYGGESYDFLGLQAPLDGTVYVASAGSVIPLNWQYQQDGEAVVSDWMDPQIRVRPADCDTGVETQYVEIVLDPGSSDYRYKPGSETHTLNWQTKGLEPGCYNVRVFTPSICQEDGPFPVLLK